MIYEFDEPTFSSYRSVRDIIANYTPVSFTPDTISFKPQSKLKEESKKTNWADSFSTDTSYKDKSFEEILKISGLDKDFKITSGYRDRNVGKAGEKSNHRHKDEKGNSYAYDIIPINGNFDLSRIRNNKIMHDWLIAKGARFIDETTPESLKKTGGTGKHWHFSFNPNSKEGVAYARKGIKLLEGAKFSIYEAVETPLARINTINFWNTPLLIKLLQQSTPIPALTKKNWAESFNPIWQLASNNQSSNQSSNQYVRYLLNKGLSLNKAKAIVGNLMQESFGNHKATSKGGSYGLFLWTGDRKDKLFKKYGNNPTWQLLLDYLFEEEDGKRAISAMRDDLSLEDNVKIFMDKFERPGNPQLLKRIQYAKNV